MTVVRTAIYVIWHYMTLQWASVVCDVQKHSGTTVCAVRFETCLLTTRRRVLLEKLTVPRLLKMFPAFYGTRRFITAFIRVLHPALSWVRSIQSIPPPTHFLKTQLNMILPTMLGSSKILILIQIAYVYIQGVTGGTDQTSGECSLGQTIPI